MTYQMLEGNAQVGDGCQCCRGGPRRFPNSTICLTHIFPGSLSDIIISCTLITHYQVTGAICGEKNGR